LFLARLVQRPDREGHAVLRCVAAA